MTNKYSESLLSSRFSKYDGKLYVVRKFASKIWAIGNNNKITERYMDK